MEEKSSINAKNKREIYEKKIYKKPNEKILKKYNYIKKRWYKKNQR